MRCLVTGAAGFIGSHLVERLLNDGHEVIAVDDFSNGRIENILDFLNFDKEKLLYQTQYYEFPMVTKNFFISKCNIRNKYLCDMLTAGVDVVFHQAALGSVPRSIDDPISTNEVNVTGTLNLLEASRKNGVKKFVYASSASVYGDQHFYMLTDDIGGRKKDEDMGKYPINPYAISKSTAEGYVKVYNIIHGMQTVSLRYFNVFGSRQNPQGPYAAVVPIFIKNFLEGKKCKLQNKGMQIRDFTYVKDVVNANILASEKGIPGSVYNISGGSRVTVRNLYYRIRKLMGKEYQHIEYPDLVPVRSGDIFESVADIEKARDQLGYNPYSEKDFDNCLDETIRWYKNNSWSYVE